MGSLCGGGGAQPAPTFGQASPMTTQQNISQNTAQQQNYTANPLIQDAAAQALWQGQSAAAQPFNIQPQQIAPFSPMQQQAFGQLQNIQGMTDPYFAQARNLTNAGAGDVSWAGNPLTQGDISQYMNPYADAALANMKKYVFDPQRTQTMGQQTQMAGGVGADRLALASQNIDKTQADAIAQAQAGFYGNAAQIAQQQRQQALASGLGLGQLGSQFGNLGTSAQGAALGATGAMLGAGSLQQQNYQQALNAQYQNALMQQAYPFQSAQFLAGMAGGMAPALGGTTTGAGTTQGTGVGYQYPSQPAIGSQIFGGALAGLGALGGPSGLKNLFGGGVGTTGQYGGPTDTFGMGYTDPSGVPIYGPGFRGGGRIPMTVGGKPGIMLSPEAASDPLIAVNYTDLADWQAMGGLASAWEQAHPVNNKLSPTSMGALAPSQTGPVAAPQGPIATQQNMADAFGDALERQTGMNPFGPGAPPSPQAPPPTPVANYTPSSGSAWAPPQWTPTDYSQGSQSQSPIVMPARTEAPVVEREDRRSAFGGRIPFALGGRDPDVSAVGDSGGDPADVKVITSGLNIPNEPLQKGTGERPLLPLKEAKFPMPWFTPPGGGGTTSTAASGTTDAGNIISSGLRVAAAVAPFVLASDRRLKTDISKLGKDKQSGVPLYAYRYKGDPKSYPKVVGPMAQDIEKRHEARGGSVGPFDVGQGFADGGFGGDDNFDFTFDNPDSRSFTGGEGQRDELQDSGPYTQPKLTEDPFYEQIDRSDKPPITYNPTTPEQRSQDTTALRLASGEPGSTIPTPIPTQGEGRDVIAAAEGREAPLIGGDTSPPRPQGQDQGRVIPGTFMLPRSQQPFAGATGEPDKWRAVMDAGLKMMGSTRGLAGSISEAGQAYSGSMTEQRKELRSEEEINQKAQKIYQDAVSSALPYNRMTLAEQARFAQENLIHVGTTPEGYPVYLNKKTGKEQVGETKLQTGTPQGYVRNPDGTYSAVKGGPADPEVIAGIQKAKSGAQIPDETAHFLAERVLAGDAKALVGLGRGAQGAENIIRIQSLVAQKAAERGMNAQDILAKIADQSGLTASQRTFGTQIARMAVNSTEAEGAIHQGLEVSRKVDRGKWVPLNELLQKGEASISDPNLLEFRAANMAIINTYARAINPTGIPHEGDKIEARRVVSEATSPEAYERVMNRMLKEIEIAHAAPAVAKRELEKIRKSSAAPVEPTTTAPTLAPRAGLSERDQAALDWANKNKDDPRAIEIKKRLGEQ